MVTPASMAANLPERMRPVSNRGLANCRNAGAAVRFADAAASAQLLCDEA
jgi:hypothetical protein